MTDKYERLVVEIGQYGPKNEVRARLEVEVFGVSNHSVYSPDLSSLADARRWVRRVLPEMLKGTHLPVQVRHAPFSGEVANVTLGTRVQELLNQPGPLSEEELATRITALVDQRAAFEEKAEVQPGRVRKKLEALLAAKHDDWKLAQLVSAVLVEERVLTSHTMNTRSAFERTQVSRVVGNPVPVVPPPYATDHAAAVQEVEKLLSEVGGYAGSRRQLAEAVVARLLGGRS